MSLCLQLTRLLLRIDLFPNIRKGQKQTYISGLCREGQLEIGVQEARKRRSGLSDDALLALAREYISRT